MVIIFQNFNLWLQPASLRASLYRETDSKNTFSLKHIFGLILTDICSILLLKKLVLNVYYTFTAYREIIKKITCIYWIKKVFLAVKRMVAMKATKNKRKKKTFWALHSVSWVSLLCVYIMFLEFLWRQCWWKKFFVLC